MRTKLLHIARRSLRGLGRWLLPLCCVLACPPVGPAPQREVITAASSRASDSTHADSDSASALYTTVPARDSVDSEVVSQETRERTSIDALGERERGNVVLAYALPGGRIALEKDSTDLPDSAAVAYAILRDSAGRIRLVSASPLSESGDWLITETHYFDSTGSTIVMVRFASFFNGCTIEATDSTIGIKEKATSYFDSQHRLIRRSFVRTTFDETTPAPSENCNRSFRDFYEIYPSWDSLSAATGLGSIVRSTHD